MDCGLLVEFMGVTIWDIFGAGWMGFGVFWVG